MVHWGDLALLLLLGRVWRLHVVSFFVWTAAWGKVLITDHLRKSSFTIMDWCCLCRCNGESVDHLLLHCGEVSQLWSFALRSFGVYWILPMRVIDLLANWRNWLGKHSSNVWSLDIVWCGLFGGREIITYLKIRCFLEIRSWLCLRPLCLIGLMNGDLLLQNPLCCF